MASYNRGRLLTASLITLAAALIVGAGAGWAANASPESVLVVAQPMEGDRADYEMHATPDDNRGTYSPWRMEWRPSEVVQDAQGSWRAGHVLHRTFNYVSADGDHNFTWWQNSFVDPESSEVFQSRGTGGWGFGRSMANFLIFSYESEARTDVIRTSYEAQPLTCGLALAEPVLKTGQRIEVLGACLEGASAEFLAQGYDNEAGMPAMRLEAADENSTVTLWYAEGISMPVRRAYTTTYQAPDQSEPTTYSSVFQMIGYERGHAPMSLPGHIPAPAALPDVVMAARQPWGPDDSGIDHAFPASKAWEVAVTRSVEFAAFMEENPEALAHDTYGFNSEDGSEASWWFQVAGTDSAAGVFVTRQATVPWRLTPGGPPMTPPDESYTYQVHFFEDEPSPWNPSPDQLSKDLPTVASVLARWEAMDVDSQELPVSWSTSSLCVLTDCESWNRVAVGRAVHETADANLMNAIFDQSTSATYNGSLLVVDVAGGPVAMEELTTVTTTDINGPLASPSPAPEPSTQKTPDGLAVVAWSMPPPPAAAGVSGFALLIGALYYLWPSIKSAPLLGLFSRLRRDELLEHPMRAAAMGAIETQPGIHLSELVRRVGSTETTVTHHVRALERAKLVKIRRSGRYTCLFPKALGQQDVQATVALKSPGAKAVLEEIRRSPGSPAGLVAKRTGLDAGTVSYHAGRLETAGLIERTRDGRTVRLHALAQTPKLTVGLT